MKILISTDIEGVAGVFHPEQTRAGNGEYERARRWMSAEANAAACAAFDEGATAVLINDSHGGFRNLIPDLFDARVRLVLGKPRTLGMMSGLEEGCNAVMMIGYHARAQSRGILAHTINGFAFARIVVNGQELGEAGLYGALAGELGVPVALASGDDVFIDETRILFPNATWVQTKTAHGQHSGVSLTPAQAQEAIEHAVKQAMQGLHTCQPFCLAPPMVCELTTQTPAQADLFCLLPTLERTGGVTLRFQAPDMQATIRTLNSLAAMSFMLR